MKEVLDFLEAASIYYIASIEKNEPRVRPFGTVNIFDGKLYIQTGKSKDFSKQIQANPKIEICACHQGDWIRVNATLIEDDRKEAKASMLDKYPSLQKMYSPDDDNTLVLYLKDAVATISSRVKETKIINF
jgi:Uncharacterized conserved protein